MDYGRSTSCRSIWKDNDGCTLEERRQIGLRHVDKATHIRQRAELRAQPGNVIRKAVMPRSGEGQSQRWEGGFELEVDAQE